MSIRKFEIERFNVTTSKPFETVVGGKVQEEELDSCRAPASGGRDIAG